MAKEVYAFLCLNPAVVLSEGISFFFATPFPLKINVLFANNLSLSVDSQGTITFLGHEPSQRINAFPFQPEAIHFLIGHPSGGNKIESDDASGSRMLENMANA